MDPEIILFDEPTSALDPTMVSEVLAVIRKLAREGMTLAIVTHEMDFARDVSNRVLYMNEGLIYEDGSPEQIFGNPQRDKTKSFINRIRSFNYHIDSPDFDLYKMNAEIELFCEKHAFSHYVEKDILLVIEELLMLYKAQSKTFGVDLRVAYSEKHNSIEITFVSLGEEGNILDKADEDDIGVMIIKNKAEKIEYERFEEKNELIILLKQV
jgi:polar amino acid transport system ATP-binding protein